MKQKFFFLFLLLCMHLWLKAQVSDAARDSAENERLAQMIMLSEVVINNRLNVPGSVCPPVEKCYQPDVILPELCCIFPSQWYGYAIFFSFNHPAGIDDSSRADASKAFCGNGCI